MRKVTIEDISRDTGLSRGTVSRALNDRPDISAQTKQKVLETCRKLNYVPSHAARSLATGRNYAVAVLVNDLQSAYPAGFVRGITEAANQHHYAVHVIDLGEARTAEDHLGTLSPERIDAVLNMTQMEADTVSALRSNIEERVLVSTCELVNTACDVFSPDHREAGRMAARFCIRNGARELLYVHVPSDTGDAERLEGFQQICREAGLNADDVTAIIDNVDEIANLKPRFERAEAIAASNDNVAISIMMACMAAGRKPGEDLAIVGYGDELAASRISPDLTTINIDSEEIGRRAMQAVIRSLSQDRDVTNEHAEIAPRLVRRASTRHFTTG